MPDGWTHQQFRFQIIEPFLKPGRVLASELYQSLCFGGLPDCVEDVRRVLQEGTEHHGVLHKKDKDLGGGLVQPCSPQMVAHAPLGPGPLFSTWSRFPCRLGVGAVPGGGCRERPGGAFHWTYSTFETFGVAS